MRAPLPPRPPRPRGAATAGPMGQGTGDVPMVRRGKEDMNVRLGGDKLVHVNRGSGPNHRTRCGIPFDDIHGYRSRYGNLGTFVAVPATCLECLGAP